MTPSGQAPFKSEGGPRMTRMGTDGAGMNIFDRQNRTELDLARKNNNREISKI